MKTYLVTGAAGFIGANYIKYLLHKKYVNEDIKVIILDALTYAGNLGTIIRIADWFGIEDIFCSQETADCWNPKVVQMQ